MREADKIVVLGDEGTILQQGSFSSLNLLDGYVQSLLVEEKDEKSTPDSGLTASNENAKKPSAVAAMEPDAQKQLLRQTGDFKVYKYYWKSIGWRHGLLIVALSFCAEFCLYFPRKFLYLLRNYHRKLIMPRALDQMVGGGGHSPPRRETRYVLWSVCHSRCIGNCLRRTFGGVNCLANSKLLFPKLTIF